MSQCWTRLMDHLSSSFSSHKSLTDWFQSMSRILKGQESEEWSLSPHFLQPLQHFETEQKSSAHNLVGGPKCHGFICISIISSLSNLVSGTEPVKTDHTHKAQHNPIIPISTCWHILYHHILCSTPSGFGV